MSEESKIFEDWCKQVENVVLDNPVKCWRILELNISNICNLKCPFCPQSFGFNPSTKFMDIEVIKKVSEQLNNVLNDKFKGFVCLAGFGEPTLHPQFMDILKLLKDFKVQLVTNGSYNSDLWEYISNNYPNVLLKVSVHEWDKFEEYRERFKNCNRVIFRNHDMKNPNMNLYNRAGNVPLDEKPTTRMCHYPFYKLMVDIDGSYLCCEADWTGSSKTNNNVFNLDITDYFLNILSKNRIEMLKEGGRQNITSNICCKKCSINGMLCGSKFVDYFKNLKNS
jgi:organic radical activating enzyme